MYPYLSTYICMYIIKYMSILCLEPIVLALFSLGLAQKQVFRPFFYQSENAFAPFRRRVLP